MLSSNPFQLRGRFHPALQPSGSKTPLCFCFTRTKIFTAHTTLPDLSAILDRVSPEEILFQQLFGRYEDRDCYVIELAETASPGPEYSPHPLRAMAGVLPGDIFTLAGRGLQILHWNREHRYCGRCGRPTIARKEELAKWCERCGQASYPTINPCVIMTVTRGATILLGRAPRFPDGMYSTLAGFVEPGETLEEAVAREVFEETGIRVKNVRYQASQPWPFPHSLMMGFCAEYDGGEISIDSEELEDAQWFAIDDLPKIPSRVTIARLLIDSVRERLRPGSETAEPSATTAQPTRPDTSPPVSFPLALQPPGSTITPIDETLLARGIDGSRKSPRKRIILPLHKDDEANVHRMLNCMQPGSYIRPHRHMHPPRMESVVVLRGILYSLIFTDSGILDRVDRCSAAGPVFGIDTEPGRYHTFLAGEADTVIFEVKPGPYRRSSDKDFAPWAPDETCGSAADYLAVLEDLIRARFGG